MLNPQNCLPPKFDEREPTDGEIVNALARPGSFAYFGGNDELFVTWSLGPVIRTRDSSIVEESNADCLEKMLKEDPTLDDEYSVERMNHWAVGWVDHITFRVIDEKGEPTRIFRILSAWFDALSDYPVADEEDVSRREYESTIEGIVAEGERLIDKEKAPEDWPSQVFGAFWNGNGEMQEMVSGGDYPCDGPHPRDRILRKVIKQLGWLDPEYDEEDEDEGE